jgi:hypothetical protein
MRGPLNPYGHMQQYWKQYLDGISWRPLSFEEQRYVEKVKKVFVEQQRKILAKIHNPFKLCPNVVTLWLPAFPTTAIGLSISSLNDISVIIRQGIEPTLANAFTAIEVLKLRVPISFTFLTLFSSLGLLFTGKINKLIQTSLDELNSEQENRLNRLEEKLNFFSLDKTEGLEETIWEMIDNNTKLKSNTQAQNPFDLTNRSMTVFFPLYQSHTELGILFHDLDYMGISILQALDPNDRIFSLFRIIHVRLPFALVLLVLFLLLGLFLSNAVNEVEQGTREEIIKDVKEGIQEMKKNF